MKHNKRERKAFTLVEVVFVIMVLGIVASIGSEIIAQVFKSYILQRAQYRAGIKTELALNQIANRLRYKIAGTVGARDSKTASFVPVTDINDSEMSVLQWVAYDGDSFEAISSSASTGAARRPGWSGFCDLNASTASTIKTPASNLSLATQIVSNLGGNINNGVIYFPDESDYNISSVSGTTITLATAIPSGSSMYERYKLAWSSYALSVESGDLFLYYNFSPTPRASLGSQKSLLMKNVSNFRFKGSEGSMRIKICKTEQISQAADDNITSCKEKVIF